MKINSLNNITWLQDPVSDIVQHSDEADDPIICILIMCKLFCFIYKFPQER
ncbi:MAG: hypothetical protein GTO45_30805 [Candidatus Aminicenantes bacterium]|nr:hypothetical protein [Candidatus Aminicenantes bacterium]